MADVLVAVLQGRSWERAEGAVAEVDPQAMLQKVRSSMIQETPFGIRRAGSFRSGIAFTAYILA